MSDKTYTIAVATEPLTKTFQLGETVGEIASSVPDHELNAAGCEKVMILTNNTYLKGWCTQHGHDAELVDDDDLVKAIKNDVVNITIIVPAMETLAIHPEKGIALVAEGSHILARIQDELLRTDDDGHLIHEDQAGSLMLPPDYRMFPSPSDPDVYLRAIAQPKTICIDQDDDDPDNTDNPNDNT